MALAIDTGAMQLKTAESDGFRTPVYEPCGIVDGFTCLRPAIYRKGES
jgi:hypothetical protein